MGRENAKGIAPSAERRRVHVGDCAGRGAPARSLWSDCAGRGAPARSCRRLRRARSASAFMSEIAPGAERRRVHVGDCAGRGAPARSLWGKTSISSSARGAPLAHRLVFYGPLAHLNEFDRRGHKKPAPRKGRGRLTQLGGERGIRTPGTVTRTRAFQARSFSHSDTSPGVQLSRGGLIVGLQR